MESPLPDRLPRGRDPLPNLRGEDETELSYLTNLIETQAWILFPSKHCTCVVGRHPGADSRDADTAGPKFCAALYSMGKGGTKGLDLGPKMGQTRKEALGKLMRLVELRVGEMMIDDREEVKERERERR